MNPNMVAQNRTARLVAESKTPTYTSETPTVREREHLTVVEMDSGIGRYWSKPMPDSDVDDYISKTPQSYDVSDIDHAAQCWCFK
jgi:hypothetical protein